MDTGERERRVRTTQRSKQRKVETKKRRGKSYRERKKENGTEDFCPCELIMPPEGSLTSVLPSVRDRDPRLQTFLLHTHTHTRTRMHTYWRTLLQYIYTHIHMYMCVCLYKWPFASTLMTRFGHDMVGGLQWWISSCVSVTDIWATVILFCSLWNGWNTCNEAELFHCTSPSLFGKSEYYLVYWWNYSVLAITLYSGLVEVCTSVLALSILQDSLYFLKHCYAPWCLGV